MVKGFDTRYIDDAGIEHMIFVTEEADIRFLRERFEQVSYVPAEIPEEVA